MPIFRLVEMLNINLNVQQVFHPGTSFPQNAIIPQTGNTSLSQSAGAVWGQALSPPSSVSASYFISN